MLAYKIIAVVVTFLAADPHLNFVVAGLPSCFQKFIGMELMQKFISGALWLPCQLTPIVQQ